jgi:hypothetical protein
LGRKATGTRGGREASGHPRRRQPALHRRLPSTRLLLSRTWTAMAETGVRALGALAVGVVAVPAEEETGALPRTLSRSYGRSCLRYDRSSSALPGAPLVSEQLYPRPPLHLYVSETCRGGDGWEIGRVVSHRVIPTGSFASKARSECNITRYRAVSLQEISHKMDF